MLGRSTIILITSSVKTSLFCLHYVKTQQVIFSGLSNDKERIQHNIIFLLKNLGNAHVSFTQLRKINVASH